MLIKQRKSWEIPASEVTPRHLYLQRRRFLALGAAGALMAPASLRSALAMGDKEGAASAIQERRAIPDYEKGAVTLADDLTAYESVTTYCNFFEFGTDKGDPVRKAPGLLKTHPWSVRVDGHVEAAGQYAVEDLIKPHRLEERIYRLRCVEAWSMVVPWIGIPLAAVLEQLRPTSKAKFVAFQTLHDPEQMPAQKSGGSLDWPYVEGLRLDEAMHPLTFLAVGLYGEYLPAQNGAPIRLVVPWKYGFKSIKSIVRIALVEEQPPASWNLSQPDEYGFYANVNPEVDHPRWSQARERRIGEFGRRDTLMFNGYGEAVADLYAGMDLNKHF